MLRNKKGMVNLTKISFIVLVLIGGILLLSVLLTLSSTTVEASICIQPPIGNPYPSPGILSCSYTPYGFCMGDSVYTIDSSGTLNLVRYCGVNGGTCKSSQDMSYYSCQIWYPYPINCGMVNIPPAAWCEPSDTGQS